MTRGGRDLLRKRQNLAAAGLTEDQWRQQWEAARLFLTADGEAGKAWGNETIRFNPDEGWLELKLPAPLASPGEPAARPVPAVVPGLPSPTGVMRSPPRPPPARSATTSAATRHRGAGTSTAVMEDRPPGPPRRWGNYGATRWWPST